MINKILHLFGKQKYFAAIRRHGKTVSWYTGIGDRHYPQTKVMTKAIEQAILRGIPARDFAYIELFDSLQTKVLADENEEKKGNENKQIN